MKRPFWTVSTSQPHTSRTNIPCVIPNRLNGKTASTLRKRGRANTCRVYAASLWTAHPFHYTTSPGLNTRFIEIVSANRDNSSNRVSSTCEARTASSWTKTGSAKVELEYPLTAKSQLQSVAPTESPFFILVYYHQNKADALMTFTPSEACKLVGRAFTLPLCAWHVLPSERQPKLSVVYSKRTAL